MSDAPPTTFSGGYKPFYATQKLSAYRTVRKSLVKNDGNGNGQQLFFKQTLSLPPGALYRLLQEREQAGAPFFSHLEKYAHLGEQGLVEAQNIMVRHYYRCNDPQMPYWAELAAAQNSAEAQYCLAEHKRRLNQTDAAIALYQAAAGQNFTAAALRLGQIYRFGLGAERDDTQAEAHLRQAAERSDAALLLAQLLDGQNRREAAELFAFAADSGHSGAQAEWAQQLMTGRMVERDFRAALRYAEPAAEKQHPDALRIMGDLYRYGLGVSPDHNAAQNFYRRAAALGSLAAFGKLLGDAALYGAEQYERLKAAALEQQQADRLYRQAQALSGRPSEHPRARQLLLEAAEYGHIGASADLGEMYYYGNDGRNRLQSAAYRLEAAAEQGHAAAQFRLAHLYYYGQGVACHLPTACRWLEAAAENGYADYLPTQPLLAQWRKEQAAAKVRF